jgi:hypothetical protein
MFPVLRPLSGEWWTFHARGWHGVPRNRPPSRDPPPPLVIGSAQRRFFVHTPRHMSGHTPWSEIRHKGEGDPESERRIEGYRREIEELLEEAADDEEAD